MTVIEILEEVNEDFCMNYCKYKEECDEKMEANEDLRECPLDRLGGVRDGTD